MLLDVFFLSLLIGRVLGGRFSTLAELEVRGAGWIVSGFVLQWTFVVYDGGGAPWWQAAGPWANLAAYLLLMIGIWQNRAQRAFWVIGAGVLANFLVIAANGGRMPVAAESLVAAGLEDHLPVLVQGTYPTHALLTSHSRLPFLADLFPLPRPYPRPKVFSVGDVIMAVGVVALIFGGMGVGRTRRARGRPEPAPPPG